jgi:hypothetical protein
LALAISFAGPAQATGFSIRHRFLRHKLATYLGSLAVAGFVAGSAQASMIAGWDFSQYTGDGFMSIDGGGSFTNTLDANYSDLDPSFGAGAESAAFGTMYANGQFGSTNVPAGTGNEQFLPSAAVGGSLNSNLTAPGGTDFDSFTVLLSEGQASAESLAMIAAAQSTVVFEADLGSVPVIGSNWSISFGGRTANGASSVGVSFSSDGVTFTSFGTAALTTVDTLFTYALGTAATNNAYVRLSFNPSGINQPLIDNVALNATLAVPEPSTAVFGALGLIGLVIAGRKQNAARG